MDSHGRTLDITSYLLDTQLHQRIHNKAGLTDEKFWNINLVNDDRIFIFSEFFWWFLMVTVIQSLPPCHCTCTVGSIIMELHLLTRLGFRLMSQ